jgi:chaperonin GroEL
VVDGVRFERGWISAYFVNDPAEMRAALEAPLVLLSRSRLAEAADVVPAVEQAIAARRPLLVVAESVEGEALSLLVVNQLRGVVRACAVPAPDSGDRRDAWFADLAALSGARVLGDEAGLTALRLPPDALGTLRRAVVDRGTTTLLEAAGRRAAVLDHVAGLRRAAATAHARFDRERLVERIARLEGGLASIEVGAASEVELRERKGRADDAVAALKAALAEGIVPGGGTALVRAARAVEERALPALAGDARAGALAVARALLEPARRIAENAGAEGGPVLARLRGATGAMGFDAELDRFTDLFRSGVVDPVQVVRAGLRNAASIAGLLLTADALVVDDESPPAA